MEIIEPGKFVALTYDLYDITDSAEEKLLHQVAAEQPETMVYGVTPYVLEPLADAIKGLKKGDEFTATLTPASGFGEYSDDLLKTETLPRDLFETDGKLDEKQIHPGAQIFLQTSMGQEVAAVVLSVDTETISVKVDFNHPLAGRTLKFRGKVHDVRQATAEETAREAALAAGGCGGCGGGCGSGSCGCDGGDCGDGGCCQK